MSTELVPSSIQESDKPQNSEIDPTINDCMNSRLFITVSECSKFS